MLFKVLNTGQEPSHHLPASTPVHIYFNMTDQIRFVFIFDFFFFKKTGVSGNSYPCFPLQQVTCKSKYDVGVNEDRPQVYDAGVGLPSSGRPR